MSTPNFSHWITLAIFCFLTIMFLYEAWVNLVNQKVSRFSVDGVLVYIFRRVGTKKTRKNAKDFPRNKGEIIFFGICALLAGLKGILEIIAWIGKYKL